MPPQGTVASTEVQTVARHTVCWSRMCHRRPVSTQENVMLGKEAERLAMLRDSQFQLQLRAIQQGTVSLPAGYIISW